jgi:hypothetical protein
MGGLTVVTNIMCLRCILKIQLDAFTVHHSSSWNKIKQEVFENKHNFFGIMKYIAKFYWVVMYIQLHGTICWVANSSLYMKTYILFLCTPHSLYLFVSAQKCFKELISAMHLTRKVKCIVHKLFMDNYFSSLQLFSALCNRIINCCGIVCQNRHGKPANFGPNTLKWKKGGNVCKVKVGTSAVCW